MAIHTKLRLRLPNSPGALAGICRSPAEERVSVIATVVESSGQVRLVVPHPVLPVISEARHILQQ